MKYKKIVVVVLVVIVVSCIGSYVVYARTLVHIKVDQLYPVTSILDGDTFKVKVDHHVITVRMLGIDTPETIDPRKPEQCYGKIASDETKLVLTGQKVQLLLNPDREEKDKFGRYLAYVHRDKIFVNEYLLENGFAREYTYGKPYLFQKEFRAIEKSAQENKKGLWGECPDALVKKKK